VKQDTPPIPAALFCQYCCCSQPVTAEASTLRCTVCRHDVKLPNDPERCPRAADGSHNVYSTPAGWICSRCNAPMDEPTDAGIMWLGGSR
jgi:hypothetical protein